MFNICTRVVWRCKPLKYNYKLLTISNYATFAVRDILNETSDEAGTLLTRFAKHVALERQKICDQVPSIVKYSDYFPISDFKYFKNELSKTSKDQLATVIIYAFSYRPNAAADKFAQILNELDRHAVNNVKDMNADTILRTLYAFLFLIPNWMTRLDFYGQAMQRLFEEFAKPETQTKEYFLQLCFYMGLSKSNSERNVKNLLSILLDKHIEKYLPEMNSMDLALVSSAGYKTSSVIKNEEFNKRLLKEVLDISDISNGNDALLVTFVKSLRLQRLRSPKVCEYIENILQNMDKLKQLQPRGQIHLFAYLAENRWDSKLGSKHLVDTITEQLRKSNKINECYSKIIRGKDISTFLWSCALLNCSLSFTQFRAIETSLLNKFDAGEFNYFADQLVDSCLSLWMLGYKSKDLLQAAIEVKPVGNTKSKQPKVDSRLTVLLSAAQIEEPTYCSTRIKQFEAFNPAAKLPAHLSNDHVIPYQQVIDELLKEESVISAQLSCPISGINIPGVYVRSTTPENNEWFLEFMTPEQTLQFSKEPVSILRLKVRLLQTLGYKVKVVASSDISKPGSIRDILNDIDGSVEYGKEPVKTTAEA